MIIQCEQCRTKFRLDDSRVKDAGVKVRCAKCKHIFTVRKETPDAPRETAPQTDFASMFDQTAGTGEQSPAAASFMIEPASPPVETPQDVQASPFEHVSAEKDAEAAAPFPIETPAEEPAPAAAAPAGFGSQLESDWEKALQPDATPFPGIESEPASMDIFTTPPASDKTGLASEPAAESDIFTFQSPDKADESISQPPVFPDFTTGPVVTEEKAEEPKAVESDIFSFAAAEAAPEPAPASSGMQLPEEPPAVQAAPAAPVDEQPVAAPAPPAPTAETQEELPPLSISSRRKQSPLVKILLVILLLVAAAALYFQYGSTLLSRFTQKSASEQGSITLRSIDASYVKNESVGELLVISGEAVNNFTTPRSAIQVKGVVYGNNNQILVSKNAFCGNIITKELLATLSLDKIEAAMANQLAIENIDVPPGKTVPFMIVISKLPEGAANFGALPAGSAAAKPK